MMRVIPALLLILTACSPPPQSIPTARFNLDIASTLGGDKTQGYLRAEQARSFSFPEDHGLHPGYRNEWWYLTGNLQSADGHHFGYQLTFFSTALSGETFNGTGWQSPRIWMAHAALSDVNAQSHIALERFARENPGLAGAQSNPFRVWLENWSLHSSDIGGEFFPWSLQIDDEAFSLSLTLNPLKAPVLQGDAGLSQKSPQVGNASYYYSLTRLASSGTVQIGGTTYTVSGQSWLDREWSTSALSADQSGWDWFSLQFDDGQELMYYRLRDQNGNAHPNSDGNWTDQEAQQRRILPGEIELEEMTSWRAPNGVDYTTEWQLEYAGQRWVIRALLEDQFMDLSVAYWEGAVEILDPVTRARMGQGYLEMVRSL
jgi:predicted secreted hydrolase